MADCDIGTQLRVHREHRHNLITSFREKGLQVNVIKNLEKNKGTLISLSKYLKALGLQIRLEPINNFIPDKLTLIEVERTHTQHISFDGQKTICGRIRKKLKQKCTCITVENIDCKNDRLCIRCFDGYVKRKSLPEGRL